MVAVSSQQPVNPDLSVVIPVYGCAPCLKPLYRRLTNVLDLMACDYEIVFVDDGGIDGADLILAGLAHEDPRVVIRRMIRNAGQPAAINAGLTSCSGKIAVVMDCDLEHPPEIIPRLLQKSAEGNEMVFAIRTSRRPGLRQMCSGIFRRAIIPFRRFPNHLHYTSFSLLTRAAIDRYLQFDDRHRGYLVILDRLDLSFGMVEYRPEERCAGRSSYDWIKLFEAAIFACRAGRFPDAPRHRVPDRISPADPAISDYDHHAKRGAS
jgi:polyisoprenyl-phosphate glycosyltransferase